MTVRQAVSLVRSTHKLLSADNVINDRVVFSELNTNAKLLIKRETNLRKLWQTDTIFTTIPCLEMVEVPVSECCDLVDNENIARSKYKLPRIGEGNYQYLIQGVFSVNSSKKLKGITISRYINMKKLEGVISDVYYWIHNGYLYITSPEVTVARIIAYFEEEVPESLLYPQKTDCDSCDCGTYKKPPCRNPLDEEFKCPGYLESQVVKLTSDKLLATYHRLKLDKQDDNKED